jgi:hypothetical protein
VASWECSASCSDQQLGTAVLPLWPPIAAPLLPLTVLPLLPFPVFGSLQAFVDLALRVLEMLGAACLASGSSQEAGIVPGEGELGMGTGSGERPHAQASVARRAAACHPACVASCRAAN